MTASLNPSGLTLNMNSKITKQSFDFTTQGLKPSRKCISTSCYATCSGVGWVTHHLNNCIHFSPTLLLLLLLLMLANSRFTPTTKSICVVRLVTPPTTAEQVCVCVCTCTHCAVSLSSLNFISIELEDGLNTFLRSARHSVRRQG